MSEKPSIMRSNSHVEAICIYDCDDIPLTIEEIESRLGDARMALNGDDLVSNLYLVRDLAHQLVRAVENGENDEWKKVADYSDERDQQ